MPVGILTGFLGAGKTTLLNRMLAAPGFGRTAVIVNEFGEVGLDHLLVEAVTGDMLVLTTGCICCAARGDLLAAVDGLMARRATLGFDHIVVETTGLADPGPVINALLLGPGLAGNTSIDGVLTLVSAPDGVAALAGHAEARHQVALADRILLSKCDLAGPSPELLSRLAALNPTAPVAEARAVAMTRDLFAADARHTARPAPDHHHHHHAADARIRAVVLRAGVLEAGRLGAFIADLQGRHGAALLRLKGVAALHHAPERPTVVQAVGHLLHPGRHLDGWPGGEPRTELVAILDGVDAAAVTALWDGYCGGPAIDRPDAAALMPDGGPGLFG